MDAKCQVLRILKRSVTVALNSKAEVIILFFSMAYNMPSAFIQNLIIQKLCLHNNYPRDYCLSNIINKTLEETMQGEASQLLLYYYLLRQLPGIILVLFMGQWCDKYGRKYVMIISFVGCTISAILYFVNAWFIDWPPIFMVLSVIPAGLGGDCACFILSLMGFIRDIHPLKSVLVRVANADGMDCITQQIGPLIGGQLYLHIGAEGVFLVSAVIFIIGTIFAAIFVKDDKFKKGEKTCVILRDLFDYRGFVSSMVAVFKKRDKHFRAYILCIMVSGFITSMSYNGFNEILFLFTRLTVEWDVTTYNFYNVLTGAANAIGCLILVPLLVKVLHWSDSTIGLLGLVANVIFYYIWAFTKTSVVFYATVCLQVISTLCYVTFRSIVTKCISFTEMGKVMAIYAVVQTGAANLGQVVATQIYSHTYRFFPGAYFVFIGSSSLICIALYIWIFVDLRKNGIALEEACKEKEENNYLNTEI